MTQGRSKMLLHRAFRHVQPGGNGAVTQPRYPIEHKDAPRQLGQFIEKGRDLSDFLPCGCHILRAGAIIGNMGEILDRNTGRLTAAQ
ncbi:hypothetical protein MSKU9_0815 [Komagataeibacter diospyri]|uniref:Uncharacterized protein n=2 Tax=Komagataeibacter TaxID=1434011 RepID=A0A0N1FBK5_9PROT|nr:hypothetical protein GLUCOINTEAF2_0203656 [Komagataeibacter intermedius AF2]GCE82674.1 hypothetical protein MSKU9_0815 [Komagataeibacter diospyri]